MVELDIPSSPYSLPLIATNWERIYDGIGMRRDPYPKALIPNYARVLSTISELSFVCGLGLSDILEAERTLAGEASGRP
jgi:hypothetical protein